MPVGIYDARDLAELRCDETHALLGKAGDVHLDVERSVDAPLGHNAAGCDIEILKALEDAG